MKEVYKSETPLTGKTLIALLQSLSEKFLDRPIILGEGMPIKEVSILDPKLTHYRYLDPSLEREVGLPSGSTVICTPPCICLTEEDSIESFNHKLKSKHKDRQRFYSKHRYTYAIYHQYFRDEDRFELRVERFIEGDALEPIATGPYLEMQNVLSILVSMQDLGLFPLDLLDIKTVVNNLNLTNR